MEVSSLAAVAEDEQFYEKIEAPKYVDFSIVDLSCPDQMSWFCARIGCDQNHEVVDPDELNRSFMLRVMAARSPNVRLQRALNRQCSRAIIKCPQTAPVKSIKNGIFKTGNNNSITEKITMAKLRQHPINRFREVSLQKKSKASTLASEKKIAATGNNISKSKNLKSPGTELAYKDNSLVKKLFVHTPKRPAGSSRALVSEICSEKKKKTSSVCEAKRINQGSYASKIKGSSISFKKAGALSSKATAHKDLRGADIGFGNNGSFNEEVKDYKTNSVKSVSIAHQSAICSKTESNSEESIKPGKYEALSVDLKVSSEVLDEGDDKENRSMPQNAATFEANNLDFENPKPEENWNLDAKVKNKAFQGVKHKRTTSPKPFRLRTEERGILKEANLERRPQVPSKKKPSTLRQNHIYKIQLPETKLKRFPEDKLDKVIFRFTCATKTRKKSIFRFRKEDSGLIILPERCVQRSTPSTRIPKEPKFNRVHVPKSCSRRSAVKLL